MEEDMSPHVPLVGAGDRKVSWKAGRSFGDWHLCWLVRGDEITTLCGIPVPPKANVNRSLTDNAMPRETCCKRCWPPLGAA